MFDDDFRTIRYCKFPAKYYSERTLKIGQCLTKKVIRSSVVNFLTHGVEYQTLILCRLILFCTVEDFHADVDLPHVRTLHCSH